MLATERTADRIVAQEMRFIFIYTHWEVTKRGMESCTIITGYSGKSRPWPSINITRCPPSRTRVRQRGKRRCACAHLSFYILIYFFHLNSVAILVQCIRLDQDCLKEKHHGDFANSLGHSEICFEEKNVCVTCWISSTQPHVCKIF
jgi:hypothetical protein